MIDHIVLTLQLGQFPIAQVAQRGVMWDITLQMPNGIFVTLHSPYKPIQQAGDMLTLYTEITHRKEG